MDRKSISRGVSLSDTHTLCVQGIVGCYAKGWVINRVAVWFLDMLDL